MAKEVKSDVKDRTPDEVDREMDAHEPRQLITDPVERSDHSTRAIPQGENEPRGGRDRAERRKGDARPPAGGNPRQQ